MRMGFCVVFICFYIGFQLLLIVSETVSEFLVCQGCGGNPDKWRKPGCSTVAFGKIQGLYIKENRCIKKSKGESFEETQ